MEQEPYKVSILVPIYGVEAYIERCARSLLEQTYHNLEFVFVNDCSKDNSINVLLKTLEEYPSQKCKYKLIEHAENRGIATTRNTALAECTGDFFMFVDSDDWIEPNTIERMVSTQQKFDSDITTCNYNIYEAKGVRHYKEKTFSNTKEMLKQLLDGKGGGRLWGRLIRTSLIKKNDLHFVDGANFAEDIMMMSFLWFYAKKHALVSVPLYNYERRNISSYTNTFNAENSAQSLRNLDNTRAFFERHDKNVLDLIICQELGKVAGHMMLCSKNRNNKAYYNQELLKRLDKIDKGYRKKLPMKSQIALHLRNYELVRIYTKIGGFVKHFFDKL